MIIFDSDWNPQNDSQATARCHRIGQTQQVKVYRLITRNTYEASMFERASRKLGLETAIFGSGGLDDTTTMGKGRKKGPPVDKKELERLLRVGAYNLINDTQDDSNTFCNSDIDSILANNTRTVELERNEQKGGAFSTVQKQTFIVEGSADIDVNDPDFWQKVLPKGEASPGRILARLDDGSAIASERSREVYMKDVKQLYNTILEARQRAEDVDMETYYSFVGVLVRIESMKGVFTETQCSAATTYRFNVEKSMKRRGRVQAKFGRPDLADDGMEDEDDEGYDDDEEYGRGSKSSSKLRGILYVLLFSFSTVFLIYLLFLI